MAHGSKTSRPLKPPKITNENAAIDIDFSKEKTPMQSYLKAVRFLKRHKIFISTITLDCKLHTKIYVHTFAKNIELSKNGIVSIKYGKRNDIATNRTIVIIKAKKKPSKKIFYNQVTILMKPTNNPDRNYINIKVFKNGSLQMTGCKDMEDFNNVSERLIRILKKGKDINDKHLKYIKEPKKIGIFDVRIRMINSNFKLDYKIDRKILARLLRKNHSTKNKDPDLGYIEHKYDPTGGHSCVNIKFHYDENSRPSIFVFQTGAIIITGAKNLHHIIMAYKFVKKILDKYYHEIKIIELDPDEVNAAILEFLRERKAKRINDELQEKKLTKKVCKLYDD